MPAQQHEQFNGWSEFFACHEHRLTRYAIHLTGDMGDAEDLIQDVLVGLVRLGTAPRAALAYVLRALRNRWIDIARARAIRPEARAVDLQGVEIAAAAASDDRPRRLAGALARVPVARRELIVLKVYCGLTFREMAELLGRPLGTVTSEYARTIDELKTLVGEEVTRG